MDGFWKLPLPETHPLLQSIKNNHQEELQRRLPECDINYRYPCRELSNYMSPLMAAVVFNREDIIISLLEQGADPNMISSEHMTALHYAAVNDRFEIMKKLISAGARLTPIGQFLPIGEHEHRKRFSEVIGKLALEGNELSELCTKVLPFLELDVAIYEKRDINSDTIDMMHEHPQLHIVMIEILLASSYFRKELREIGIEWLKQNDNMRAYLNSVATRLPHIPDSVVEKTIDSLNKVCCNMDIIPQELAVPLIPLLLKFIQSDNLESDSCRTVIFILYEITLKTPEIQEWDTDVVKDLCKSMAPFVHEDYPVMDDSEIIMYTFGVLANLLPHKDSAGIFSSLEIYYVPRNVVLSAQEDTKLYNGLSQLKNFFIEKSKPKDTSVDSGPVKKKMKMDKSEMPNQSDAGCVASTSQTESSVDETKECKWNKISERWRPKLEKLHSSKPSALTRIGSMVYVDHDEFRIAQGSDGTQVFLGLKEDGTEVAIKKMLKSNYEALLNEVDLLTLSDLKHSSIVRYIDFAEDDHFGYLALELCEFTLEEVIKNLCNEDKRRLVEEFLTSLKVLHTKVTQKIEITSNSKMPAIRNTKKSKILHRDLKPQNVLIDVRGQARLADFGLSRRLPKDKTTCMTKPAGTKCWMAKEIIDKKNEPIPIKSSADVQVAGMLVYYILSGGEHPFNLGRECDIQGNILDGKYTLVGVEDVVAKDLIERMIDGEPEKRPKVEECLSHPYFWGKPKRLRYLTKIGKRDEIANYWKPEHKKIISEINECDLLRSLQNWKTKFPEELVQRMEAHPSRRGHPYSEKPVGLLRFIRNLLEHPSNEQPEVDVMSLFPDLLVSIFKFAEQRGWNSEPPLREMFQSEEGATDE